MFDFWFRFYQNVVVRDLRNFTGHFKTFVGHHFVHKNSRRWSFLTFGSRIRHKKIVRIFLSTPFFHQMLFLHCFWTILFPFFSFFFVLRIQKHCWPGLTLQHPVSTRFAEPQTTNNKYQQTTKTPKGPTRRQETMNLKKNKFKKK